MPKPMRYSVPRSESPFKALTALAGRSQLGGQREMALATLIAARLASGAIGPHRLPIKAREVRANGARNWLLSLALPQNSRAVFLRLIECSGTDDVESLSQAFAQVLNVADVHLDSPARLELGRLVHKISLEQSGEALERAASNIR